MVRAEWMRVDRRSLRSGAEQGNEEQNQVQANGDVQTNWQCTETPSWSQRSETSHHDRIDHTNTILGQLIGPDGMPLPAEGGSVPTLLRV